MYRVIVAFAAILSLLAHTANGAQTDVTRALQLAVDATPTGGLIFLPAGQYQLSAAINITKPITITGAGLGTQLFQTANATLLRINNVNGVVIANLYLGSAATNQGTSLIELANSHHNRIENVTMLGSYYGLHLLGSLLNTAIDLRSGTNFGGFFGATSTNQYWVYAEPANQISANANTLIAPVLEGGTNGIYLTDGNGQGSLTITGGTIEGVSGTALTFNNTFLPTSITGTHFEANGVGDITVTSSSNISLNTIFALTNITLSGDTRNILITGGTIEHLNIAATTKRIRVENITTGITSACPNNIVNNNSGTSPYDGSPNVILSQIGYYCYGL